MRAILRGPTRLPAGAVLPPGYPYSYRLLPASPAAPHISPYYGPYTGDVYPSRGSASSLGPCTAGGGHGGTTPSPRNCSHRRGAVS